MSKHAYRTSPIVSTNSSDQSSDGIAQEMELTLQSYFDKTSVQPRSVNLYDQINSIINNTKSKYSSVEEAVRDMQERSGFASHQKTSSDYNTGKKQAQMTEQLAGSGDQGEVPKLFQIDPVIKDTIDNYINDTRGQVPIPVILDRVKGIHKKDVSDDAIWNDSTLLAYINKKLIEAQKTNPQPNNDQGLGKITNFTDDDLDPSNKDALFALTPRTASKEYVAPKLAFLKILAGVGVRPIRRSKSRPDSAALPLNPPGEITMTHLKRNYPAAYNALPKELLDYGPDSLHGGAEWEIERILEDEDGEIVIKIDGPELVWDGAEWHKSTGPDFIRAIDPVEQVLEPVSRNIPQPDDFEVMEAQDALHTLSPVKASLNKEAKWTALQIKIKNVEKALEDAIDRASKSDNKTDHARVKTIREELQELLDERKKEFKASKGDRENPLLAAFAGADGWEILHGLTEKSFPHGDRYQVISLDRSQEPSITDHGTLSSFQGAKKYADGLVPDKADRVEIWDTKRGHMVAKKEAMLRIAKFDKPLTKIAVKVKFRPNEVDGIITTALEMTSHKVDYRYDPTGSTVEFSPRSFNEFVSFIRDYIDDKEESSDPIFQAELVADREKVRKTLEHVMSQLPQAADDDKTATAALAEFDSEPKDIKCDELTWLPEGDRAKLKETGTKYPMEFNPPAWVASEKKWDKAKKAVKKYWSDYKEPWAVVADVYRNMGGTEKKPHKS